jgi:hypothetical protein
MSRQGFPDLKVQTCECRGPADTLRWRCGQVRRSLTFSLERKSKSDGNSRVFGAAFCGIRCQWVGLRYSEAFLIRNTVCPICYVNNIKYRSAWCSSGFTVTLPVYADDICDCRLTVRVSSSLRCKRNFYTLPQMRSLLFRIYNLICPMHWKSVKGADALWFQ